MSWPLRDWHDQSRPLRYGIAVFVICLVTSMLLDLLFREFFGSSVAPTFRGSVLTSLIISVFATIGARRKITRGRG